MRIKLDNLKFIEKRLFIIPTFIGIRGLRMTSYTKAFFYLGLFLFVTVAIHEVGHLVVARRLISQEATLRLFPEFPFGRVLGLVSIPETVSYPRWKGLVTAIAGPLLATVLMFVIWLNTKNSTIAVISSFFAINQLVYSVVEPLNFVGELPDWSMRLPLLAGLGWVIPYAYYVGKNFEE